MSNVSKFTMKTLYAVAIFVLVAHLAVPAAQHPQKIQMTRTALHVARSLDPDSMESMPVKTKSGELATILVKKRAGKSSSNSSVANSTDWSTNGTAGSGDVNYVLLSSSNDAAFAENESVSSTAKNNLITASTFKSTQLQNNTDRSDNGRARVPDPVYVSSAMVFVKNELAGNSANKKARSLVKLDVDGIPVVTGVRVPDDDSDKQVWRNARVINGILVPYDKSDKEIITKTKPSRKPSPSTVKPIVDNTWTKIGSVTKKPTKLSPASSATTSPYGDDPSWNDQKWDLYKKPVTLKPLGANEPPQVLQTIETVDEVEGKRPAAYSEYKQHPAGLWIASEAEENPEHKYVTDRILEYIRNINKEEMKRLSMQKFTARDARMIPTSQEQPPQIQSRILHVPGASVFPNNVMYSLSTQPPSRVSFEEGVRTPVLQYAHPEYGVQSAKAEPTQGDIVDDTKDAYYPQDIHADRGPFVFEPATPTDDVNADVAGGDNRNNQRSHPAVPSSYYGQRPKKTLAYFYPEKQLYNAPPNNKFYNGGKYPPFNDDYKLADYPALYYEDVDGRPFWIRIGDSLKEQVQTGIDKMTDLTRPVVEPIVEATHKISQNLGLSSGNRDLSSIREKFGTVSTSSLILPAIGIVAGGAALGLGAVAVGRYLNYDVVKMRKAKSMDTDGLPIIDPTDTTHLENLWTKDHGRSSGSEISTVATATAPSSTTTAASSTTATSAASSSSTIATSKNDIVFKSRRRRRRKRSTANAFDWYFENILQSLESSDEQSSATEAYPASLWTNTPCSKRTFCEAMLAQPEDAISFMDKKIHTFLSILPSDVASTVAPHLEDVMRSVKLRNCSIHECPSWKPLSTSKKSIARNNT